jgi:hypothetical protein
MTEELAENQRSRESEATHGGAKRAKFPVNCRNTGIIRLESAYRATASRTTLSAFILPALEVWGIRGKSQLRS